MSKKRSAKFRLNVSKAPGSEDDDVELEYIPEGDLHEPDSLVEQNQEPNLIETDDGRLIIDMKPGLSCGVCKKSFATAKGLIRHQKENCPESGAPSGQFEDVLEMERRAAQLAQPSEDFYKYCDPNPENPCYCCGEDVSTAHVGHIKCKHCPKSFKAYEYMEKHLASVHAEDDIFACPQCNAKCSSAKVLNEHLLTHSEGKPFSCLRCSKDFTRKYHLERHLNHSSCGETPKLMRPCEVCGKEFNRLDNLREHLRFHMGQERRKRDYQCPYCPKSFYGSSLLNIHIRTHTGEKPFPCDLCSKSFPSTGALRKHRRSHTGERPYRCDQCSGTFAARETLNRHRKTHTGEKPHECNICHKSFIQATQLRSHMFHHTGEGGYECTECGASFNRKARLDEHVKFVHSKEQMLACPVCGKEFMRKEDLIRHQDTHTDVKNFECPECFKKFVSKSALNVHLRTHNIEKPAVCTICQKDFLRQDCLLRHMRTKHRDQYYVAKDGNETTAVAPEPIAEAAEAEEEDPHVLEIDGEVYQITPLEEVQIVRIDTKPSAAANVRTVKTEEGKKVEVVEVVNIVPPKEVPPPPKILNEQLAPKKVKKSKPIVTVPIPVEAKPVAVVKDQPPVKKERKKRKKVDETESSDFRKAKIKKEQPDDSIPIFLSDQTLKEKISELLCLLIDEEMLSEFGWPKAPVEQVLSDVIVRCGHKPARDEDDHAGDYTTRMRENTKILFSLTMDDDNIKTLLNNHTVDEVIMNVLKNK